MTTLIEKSRAGMIYDFAIFANELSGNLTKILAAYTVVNATFQDCTHQKASFFYGSYIDLKEGGRFDEMGMDGHWGMYLPRGRRTGRLESEFKFYYNKLVNYDNQRNDLQGL